jgi:DNA-binding XRE family transcriptional regulator
VPDVIESSPPRIERGAVEALEALPVVLRYWRERCRLSYGEAAAAIGVNKTWLYSVETNPSFNPGLAGTLKVLRWICNVQRSGVGRARKLPRLTTTEVLPDVTR